MKKSKRKKLVEALDKTCVSCGRKFTPKGSLQQYCNINCYRKRKSKQYLKQSKNNEGEKFKCVVCKKEFYLPVCRARVGRGKFCSMKCYTKDKKKGRTWKKCANCGEKFFVQPSRLNRLKDGKIIRQNCCSSKCNNEYRRKHAKLQVLDDLWGKAVKIRAGERCEYCGKTEHLNSHHIFSRTNNSVRWAIENGVCLCALHHWLANMSAHKAPLEFAEWLKEKRGIEWYNKLRERAKRELPKITPNLKLEIANKLEKIINGKI